MNEWITGRDPEPDELNIWGEAWVINEDHMPHVAKWEDGRWIFPDGLRWSASRDVIKWKPVTEEDME